MKSRPIIFTAPMVRALLAGAKTMTRRIVKPQPPVGHNWVGWTVTSTNRADEGKATWGVGDVSALIRNAHRVRCQHGQVGDQLWVKEPLAQAGDHGIYRADGSDLPYREPKYRGLTDTNGTPIREPWPWKRPYLPPMFCPRWASRITLEITAVRVERLQDISEQDAKAEGCSACTYRDGRGHEPATVAYRYLWESINGPGSWDDNPYVWVISFNRVPQ